jgi:hypothetical protein
MKTLLYISVGLSLAFLTSCGSAGKDLKEPNSRSARYRVLAAQNYGEGTEFVFNNGKTAVLCLKKSKPSASNPLQQVSFFVFDLSIDSTVFEDKIPDGSVSWKDSVTVLVHIMPGMVKDDEPSAGRKYGYLFDLRSRRTRSLDASSVE